MPKSSSRKYTEEFKREAVTLVLEEGQKVSEVARNLGIGRGTLDRWCRQIPEAAEVGCGDCASAREEESPRSRAEVVGATSTDRTSGGFYRAFEDRHRGSRELIKSRLRVYLAFVDPLKTIYGDCRALDLGCGRGEWLELMKEWGIDAWGIALDEGMLAACKEKGLPAEQAEAIEYLRGLPDASVGVVSAFHVAEHIPFSSLQSLVRESLRVLKPAGLLILETPNPENLSVGTSRFYLDPSHEKPIPPPLLSFLLEHCGFARTKVMRLQEVAGLRQATEVSLTDVLLGVSPDYAVVGQKESAQGEHLALFDAAFSPDYGIDLDQLAVRYDQTVGNKLTEILTRIDRTAEFESRAAAATEQFVQTQGRLADTQAQLLQTQRQLVETQGQMAAAEARLVQTQGRLAETESQLVQTQGRLGETEAQLHQSQQDFSGARAKIAEMHASTSWRVTGPLRAVAIRSRELGALPARAILGLKIKLKPWMVRIVTHPLSKRAIVATGRWLIAHPSLSEPIRAALHRHERIRNRLRWLVLGLPPAKASPQLHMDHLTPRARRVYQDLLRAIAERGERS